VDNVRRYHTRTNLLSNIAMPPPQQTTPRRLVMPPSPLVLRKSLRGANAVSSGPSFAGPSPGGSGFSESPELTPLGSSFGFGRARRLLSSMKTPRDEHMSSPRRLFSKFIGSPESQSATPTGEDLDVVVPEVDESSKMLKKVIESDDGIDSKRLFKQLIAIENLQF